MMLELERCIKRGPRRASFDGIKPAHTGIYRLLLVYKPISKPSPSTASRDLNITMAQTVKSPVKLILGTANVSHL
jgi:hypothetical protein